MAEETTKRQGIGSLEIGLHILNYISVASRPPTLKELSGALDLSPSRAHKYLVSLLREGYINQVNQTQYTLGNSSLTLGISALRRINPIQLSYAAVDRLNEETDKTVSVTVWNGNGPLIIKWLDSSQPISVNVRLGAELSPLNSASGRIYLAHLPDKRRKELIDQHYENSKSLPKHRASPSPETNCNFIWTPSNGITTARFSAITFPKSMCLAVPCSILTAALSPSSHCWVLIGTQILAKAHFCSKRSWSAVNGSLARFAGNNEKAMAGPNRPFAGFQRAIRRRIFDNPTKTGPSG